jgi:hypothetical protein
VSSRSHVLQQPYTVLYSHYILLLRQACLIFALDILTVKSQSCRPLWLYGLVLVLSLSSKVLFASSGSASLPHHQDKEFHHSDSYRDLRPGHPCRNELLASSLHSSAPLRAPSQTLVSLSIASQFFPVLPSSAFLLFTSMKPLRHPSQLHTTFFPGPKSELASLQPAH